MAELTITSPLFTSRHNKLHKRPCNNNYLTEIISNNCTINKYKETKSRILHPPPGSMDAILKEPDVSKEGARQ